MNESVRDRAWLWRTGIEVVGLVIVAMTMASSAFLSSSTRVPLQSPALCSTLFSPPASAFSRPRTRSVRPQGSEFCVGRKGRDEVVSGSFGDRVGQYAMADSSLPAQEFTFVNSNGLRLKGLLVDGGAGSKEVAILCHGFRSSRLSVTLSALATRLAEAGVSSFRFDFAGNGESEGKFAYGNYWQEVEDLRAAVEFWTSKGSRVVCVAGHSKGGNCVVLYASKYHDVPCVINICGRFALEKGILERLGGQEGLRKLEDEGVLDIKDADGNVQYQVTKADLRDRLTTNMHAACLAIPELTRVLTIHGTNDEVVPPDDAYQFAQRIPTHKLVLVKDANHGFSRHQSQLTQHFLEFLQETSALQESSALQP